ncbi:MAG: sigma-54 dependent transcriptional regulator [Acidobacteriota bacterium]|nr:sigma-54 dependent transcriptional regulator [Blastocatellia bacterium]MDW8238390.1 sigma-54 dependent transcriptional regulator [Acidobacteriota bacterium]
MRSRKILVVDDEKLQRDILQLILAEEGHQVSTAASGHQAMQLVAHEHFDLVLTDLKMPGMDGLQLLKELLTQDSSTCVIMMTAHGSIDSAKEAIKLGAYDYLEKPLERDTLLKTIQEALKQLDAIDEEIVSASAAMERVKKMILKVANSSSTVLIRGESGVGKERIARAIHKASQRSNQIFQAVNCAAINENLMESELFGHEKGSFTGAHAQKKGLFEVADQGTLFLDEIAELNTSMQAKLLRALQEKEIMRVGGTRPVKVDVRVLTATNRDLDAMVQDGRFREDLFYRINVLSIDVPPLRERREDIPVLVNLFLAKHARAAHRRISGLTRSAMEALMNYGWPGNVRQLESVIERAILLCESDQIGQDDLPPELRQHQQERSAAIFKLPPDGVVLDEVERSLIVQAMQRTDGNITQAAKLLGISFRTLQYRLEKYGLRSSPQKEPIETDTE